MEVFAQWCHTSILKSATLSGFYDGNKQMQKMKILLTGFWMSEFRVEMEKM